MKITCLVIATWLFCNVTIGSSLIYPTSKLTTDGISVGSYQSFITDVRSNLKSGATSHDILLLRKSSEITNKNMFVEVELSYYDTKLEKKIAITLALYALNSYVIGYKSETRSFFFKEAPSAAQNLLFDGTTKKPVEVYTTYDKLADRSKIMLSTGALKKSIGILHDFDGININTALKESLVVVIQMVAEATRFKLIENHIEFNLTYGYTPKGDTITYENAWDPLSEQIQLSGSDGKFKTPVQVQNADYSFKNISSVQQVKSDITILLVKGSKETIGDVIFGDISATEVVEESLVI
ncbi:ribosome-inactivating protein luffaculin 1-like [Euphorbia lathyris]|uniref:ribosome-inactivating protein luffaculin 1-like n=1 Tax=Euphorbia lathyris TaxID=212925 RepID=UPI0033140ABA